MNMLTNIEPYNFPVEIVDGSTFRIFDSLGLEMHIPSESYQAVIRTDTREVLAIHGSSYKLTPHSEIIEATNQALLESGLDLNHARVRDRVFDRGARIERRINFPQIITQPRVGDIVDFMITIRNSYDGSWRYQLDAGARRLVCLNGMTLPTNTAVRTRQRHTSAINVDGEATKIANAVDAFKDSEGVWRLWTETPVNDEQIKGVWARSLAHAPTPSRPDNVSNKLLDRLMTGWQRESRMLGRNLWAAYNASTAWATHEETVGKEHDVRKRRDERVHGMINSKEWKELAEV